MRPVYSLVSAKSQQNSAPWYVRRAPCTQLNISRESAMLKLFVRSINKSYHWDFPKVVVSKHTMKGATRNSFQRARCT